MCPGATSSAEGQTSCEGQGCYKLVLTDTYGDGWNGAILLFHESTTGNSNLVGEAYTLPSSGEYRYRREWASVCFPVGQCYRGQASMGNHPYENAWELMNQEGDTVVASATQDATSKEFCVDVVPVDPECNLDCPAGYSLSSDCTCSQCEEGKFRHAHGDAFCSYCSAFDALSVPNFERDGCVCVGGVYGKVPPGTYKPGSLARLIDGDGNVADFSTSALTLRGR